MPRVPSRLARHGVRSAAASPAVAGFRPAAAALAVAAAFSLQPLPLLAQPAGGQVIHGQATFTRSGNNLLVTTQNGAGTSHSAINWQSFSVPAGSLTQFNQPSATSTSINRVLGPDPSAILGTLRSNGRLVLVNPAGIAVGQGALVDTAGFTASTLMMSEADAIAGRLVFGGGTAGPLQVDGQVVARSGDIVLIAPRVQTGTQAVVQADGATILAAGQKVEITGRGLEGIHMEVQAGNEAVNLGTLKGDAVGIFAGTLRHSGLVAANAVTSEGGKVVLKATGGDALVDGAITATAGDKGGSIDVLGQRVGLLAGANLEASGAAGGGQVRVGGDYQGQNAEVPNAARTYVDAAATIRADATGQGDGGRVIVWADEVTRMHGRISARGGEQGGNGGFAEVSGKQYLEFTGGVDLRAPKGTTGTLLLDPNDIIIEVLGPTATTSTTPGVFSGGTGQTKIKESDLEAQLATSSVIVVTNGGTGGTGRITIATGVDLAWAGTNNLGLQADQDIDLQGSITAGSGAAVSMQALGGGVVQNASTSVVTVGNLLINAQGNVSMDGANQVDTLAANLGNNSISFVNAQALNIGSVATPYGAPHSGVTSGSGSVSVRTTSGSLVVKSSAPVTGNDVTLEGKGGIDLQGNVQGTTSVTLQAPSGGITQSTTGSAVKTAALWLQTGAGAVSMNGANLVGTLAGYAAGTGNSFSFTNAQSLAIGTVAGQSGVVADDGSNLGAVTVKTSTGNLAIAAGPSIQVRGSSVLLEAAGNLTIDAASVQANGGSLTVKAGGDVLLGTVGDPSSATFTNLDAVGKLTVEAAGSIRAGIGPSAPYPSYVTLTGQGGAGKGVLLQAGGDIDLSLNTTVTGYSSPIVVSAGGSILGSGYFSTDGSPAGSISMTARSISFGAIDSAGYSKGSGQSGGNVMLTATSGNVTGQSIYTDGEINYDAAGGNGGNLTVDAAKGTVAIGYMSTVGGDSKEGFITSSFAGAGGNAGTVTVKAGNGITLSDVNTYGGSSFGKYFAPAAGGAAGSVSLTATGGSVQIGYLDAEGGEGSQGATGGTVAITAPGDVRLSNIFAEGGESVGTATGGQGGAVRIVAGGNLVLTDPWGGGVSTFGGDSTAGVGGRGGFVDVTVGGSILVVPDPAPAPATTTTFDGPFGIYGLAAAGGFGGSGPNGLAGGQAGDIRITGTGSALILDSSLTLFAQGGEGGTYTATGGVGGTGGNGGTITIQSAGAVHLRSPNLYADGGQGGSDAGYVAVNGASGALGSFTAAGTSVEVEGDLFVNAHWTNNSIVNVRGASVVSGPGVFTNASDLFLFDTSGLFMAEVRNAGRLTTFGSSVRANLTQNTGLVEVVGGSSFFAPLFFTNAGTVQVDGSLNIGTATTSPSTTTTTPPPDTTMAGAIFSGGTFTNQASGKLTGNGSIVVDGGTGTVDNFGTIAPGGIGAVGTLTLDSNLVMESGSTYAADLLNTGSHDLLKVSGQTTTGGSFAVNYLSGASFAAGDSFSMLQSGVVNGTTLPTVNQPELTVSSTGTELQLVAVAPFGVAPAPAPVVEEAAVEQVTNLVADFSNLFVEQTEQQQLEEKEENQIGKDDIVITETACK